MNIVALERDKAPNDPITTARRWLDDFGEVALATVVATWGAAPVPVGGQLVVAPNEQFEGSVSGGCVEADVIAEAVEIMGGNRPKLLEFGVAEETAWRAGLPCGGRIEILLNPLKRERDAEFLDQILAAQRAREPVALVIDVATGNRRLVFNSNAPSEIASCLEVGESHLINMPEGPAFVHVVMPLVRVVVAGATHVGQMLAALARQIGYEVIVLDPRAAFASKERFGAIELLTGWPEASLATVRLDKRTAMVALTHASHIDDEALTTALRSPCVYIGALGSKRTHAKRLERLKEAGFSDADLARIHAPVGLNIGAQGPAEIAISILAEIVQVTRGEADA